MTTMDSITGANLQHAIDLIDSISTTTCDEFMAYLKGDAVFDLVVCEWLKKRSKDTTYEINAAIIDCLLSETAKIETFSNYLPYFNDHVYSKDINRLLSRMENECLDRELSQMICSGLNIQARINIYYKHKHNFGMTELSRIWIQVPELRNNIVVNIIANGDIEKFYETLNWMATHGYFKDPLTIEEMYDKSNITDEHKLGVIL